MYHVVGTGIVATILYLISYYFYRTGFYSLQLHRKLWNSILAIAFLLTALAGLFLAFQVNYKWNLPLAETILKWHVEFGAGLAFTGLFHFLWHFSYYTGLFKRTYVISDSLPMQSITGRETGKNLFIIGVVSSSVQLLLLREMMNITGGYELISGTFLGSWLIASATGSWLAGRSGLNDLRKINISFSVSPLISLFLLLLLSRLFLQTGQSPSFLVSFIYTLLVLLPFCLVSGFTFIRLIHIARSSGGVIPGKSFSIETAGGIVSGILISVLTAGLLNTWQLLFLIIILNNAYAILTFRIRHGHQKLTIKLLVTGASIFVLFFNIDVLFRQVLLPGIKVTGTEDTPYGNITTGLYAGEQSIYYNHRLLSYAADAVQREENIHYALLQSDNPGKIVLISGNLPSHLHEIEKYDPGKIVYIERDPVLTKMVPASDSLKHEVNIENTDAFTYIKNSDETADAIILLVPPPSTLLLNRYYSAEFFQEVKRKLNPGGIFMCSPGPADSYLNDESVRLYSSVFNSLSPSFKNVIPVSGNKLYFIASDKELSTAFCSLTNLRKIENIYVGCDFLSDDLVSDRSEEITSRIDPEVKQNSSASPVAYFNFQSYTFSRDINEKIPALALMVALFAVPVFGIKRRNLVMYAGASALSGFEIILLLTLQLVAGNMYQLTGLMIAGLMAGLAIGAGFRFPLNVSVSIRIIFLTAFYLATGIIFNFLTGIRSEFFAVVILLILAFIPGLLTGSLFRELTIENDNDQTTKIYGADLAGSALGFILVSAIAVPLLGIRSTIFLFPALIFAGWISGMIRSRR